MKTLLRLLFIVTLLSSFASCSPLDDEEVFEAEMIVGTWTCDGLYETYNDDLKTGKTWSENDGETKEDAHNFTWSLETNGDLLQIHIMEIGGSVPRALVVTELTPNTLTYEDLGTPYTFTKVKEE